MKTRVVVIDAFGRGHWLARRLTGEGFDLTLCDLSEGFSGGASFDSEGPFGIFGLSRFEESQRQFLEAEDYIEEVHQGFSIWPGFSSGPVELRGPFSSFQSEARPELSYFFKASQGQVDLPEDFDRSWLWNFAGAFASHAQIPNIEGALLGAPLALGDEFGLRRATRKGFLRSIEGLLDQGVRIHRCSGLVDLQLGTGSQSIEVKGNHEGAVTGEIFVWLLSSFETSFLSQKISQAVFGGEALIPDWKWVKGRVQIHLDSYEKTLPSYFVSLGDIYLPWQKDNLLVFRKLAPTEFEVWFKAPMDEKKWPAEALLERVRQHCHRRFEPFQWEFECEELDSSSPATEVPRFVTYDLHRLSQKKRKKSKNVFFGGPEFEQNQDWGGRFSQQEEIFAQVIKAEKQIAKRKQVHRDPTLHP